MCVCIFVLTDKLDICLKKFLISIINLLGQVMAKFDMYQMLVSRAINFFYGPLGYSFFLFVMIHYEEIQAKMLFSTLKFDSAFFFL